VWRPNRPRRCLRSVKCGHRATLADPANRGEGAGRRRCAAAIDLHRRLRQHPAAWQWFLAHTDGKPVVLTGDSQGSAILIRLISAQLDNEPSVLRRLLVVILLGGNLQVPVGKTAGATFTNVPLCIAGTQTGCAIAGPGRRQRRPRPYLSTATRTRDQPHPASRQRRPSERPGRSRYRTGVWLSRLRVRPHPGKPAPRHRWRGGGLAVTPLMSSRPIGSPCAQVSGYRALRDRPAGHG
jgi:Protein of unknown function (DUF3089)